MAETQIEWTDATWNPVAGCSIKSAGCKNCYAMQMAKRLEAMHVNKVGRRLNKVSLRNSQSPAIGPLLALTFFPYALGIRPQLQHREFRIWKERIQTVLWLAIK